MYSSVSDAYRLKVSMQDRYLIVGVDGLIGRALREHLRELRREVVCTTRREGNARDGAVYLDIADAVEDWDCPDGIDVAVICASVSNLRECKENPVESARVNVEGVVEVAHRLAARGVFIVFLSSSQVFDGTSPLRKADEARCPVTEYGRQKAAAECRIEELGERAAIVRMTKIVDSSWPLLAQWREDLLAGRAVHPFADMVFSPVSLSFATSAICRVAEDRLTGITQVSGKTDISYAQAAYRIAEVLGVDPSLVQPIRTCQSDVYSEPLVRHTTLDMGRLQATLGIEPPDALETVEAALMTSQAPSEGLESLAGIFGRN